MHFLSFTLSPNLQKCLMSKRERIDPTSDIAFKMIFGTCGNEDLLVTLINSAVAKEDTISAVTIGNPCWNRDSINHKQMIMNINANGEDGKQLNLEIQVRKEKDYEKRALVH